VKETLNRRFNRLLEDVLAELPGHLTRLLDEVPLLVDDWPTEEMLHLMGEDEPWRLCGLYTGIPLTHRSVLHSGVMPDRVQIFRDGIIAAAASRSGHINDADLKRQIRITLLHEMGHHFGLEEQELHKLGYG